MKKIILFITFLFIANFYKSQLTYQWAKSAGSVSGSEYGQAIASDPSGNVYVTGTFSNTVDFDPSANTATLSSLGGLDIFLAKYNSAGALVWVKQIAGSNDERPFDLVADATGAYLAGIFIGTVDFDPTTGTHNITYLGGGTDGDGFFAKYDVNGNLTWVDRIGSTANDRVTAITVDASQNVFVTGFIGGNADMDPGTPIVTFSASSVYNAFFGKYSSTGAYIFAKQITGSYSDAYDINLDGISNIYITGSFSQTNDFNPGTGTANLSTSSYLNADVYIAKYDAMGNYVLAKQVGGTGIDIGFQIMPDASGNIYLGGTFSSVCDFDPTTSTHTITSAGQGDLFVSKYDATGNLLWANGTGGTTNDYCYGLALDAANNVYITGKFQGTNIDFDPSASSALLTASSSGMYIASYSSAGNYLSISSPGNIHASGNGIIVNSSVYVTGFFDATADFDFSTSTSTLTSLGGDDIFFAKYNACSGTPPAQPSAIAGNFTVCNGTANTFSVTNDPLATSYTWNFPIGWTGTSATNVSVPTVNSNGVISVVATNSCGASPASTVSIVVNPNPTVIATSNTSVICVGQSATLTASGANTYTWNTASTNTNIIISPTVTTTYTVGGTNINGCYNGATVTQSVSLCTEIESILGIKNANFNIYPNPFKDEISLSITNFKKEVNVKIYNSISQLVFKTVVSNPNSFLNLSELSSGFYYMKLEIMEEEKVLKLVKE